MSVFVSCSIATTLLRSSKISGSPKTNGSTKNKNMKLERCALVHLTVKPGPNGEPPWWPHWLKVCKCRESPPLACGNNLLTHLLRYLPSCVASPWRVTQTDIQPYLVRCVGYTTHIGVKSERVSMTGLGSCPGANATGIRSACQAGAIGSGTAPIFQNGFNASGQLGHGRQRWSDRPRSVRGTSRRNSRGFEPL